MSTVEKSTPTDMKKMRNFEVISDKFNLARNYTYVISSSQSSSSSSSNNPYVTYLQL